MDQYGIPNFADQLRVQQSSANQQRQADLQEAEERREKLIDVTIQDNKSNIVQIKELIEKIQSELYGFESKIDGADQSDDINVIRTEFDALRESMKPYGNRLEHIEKLLEPGKHPEDRDKNIREFINRHEHGVRFTQLKTKFSLESQPLTRSLKRLKKLSMISQDEDSKLYFGIKEGHV